MVLTCNKGRAVLIEMCHDDVRSGLQFSCRVLMRKVVLQTPVWVRCNLQRIPHSLEVGAGKAFSCMLCLGRAPLEASTEVLLSMLLQRVLKNGIFHGEVSMAQPKH